MSGRERARGRPSDPRRAVRSRFLAPGNPYGCAESTLITLQEQFGLPDERDGAAAMALNGGVGYSGGTCGAITGAALALGRLAAERIPDRREAKRVARELTGRVIDEFQATFGALDCRTLTGVDLRAPGGHDAFIAAGQWRVDCLRRLELVVAHLAPLADPEAWERSARVGDGDRDGAKGAPGRR
ncbi:MAG: C_GCAxxG_C_C family protein [Chloroflexi bacterium]|nr:C_GCAxxG_C_C family protein [Chloroflexota bacterium]